MVGRFYYTFLLLGIAISSLGQGVFSGTVKDSLSKQQLSYTTISCNNFSTLSNQYGFFSIAYNSLKDTLHITNIGYQTKHIPLSNLFNDSKSVRSKIIYLNISDNELNEIVVKNVKKKAAIGFNTISTKQLKQIPALMGEKDALKAIQYLPGVQKGLEGSTSFYVRGGSAGENLILLDEATIYNANHLFGFFSVFNSDAIRGIDFYKGAFPSKFGGRISSVSDLRMKDGNNQRFQVDGGISLISSRITIQGPILKNNLSFLVSARRTYLDPFLKLFQSGKEETSYNFYDLNAKLKWDVNEKNTMFLSSYFGKDKLNNDFKDLESDFNYSLNNSSFVWGNRTTTLRWNHLYGERLFSNTSFLSTKYNSSRVNSLKTKRNNIENLFYNSFNSEIKENTLKTDFEYYLSNNISMMFGTWFSNYGFVPRSIRFINTDIDSDITNKIQSENQSFGLYYSSKWTLGEKTKFYVGARAVKFNSLLEPKFKLEPRLSIEYNVKSTSSLSISYSRMNQFINQVQSTGLGISTDLWFPADNDFNPQQSDQVSISSNSDLPYKLNLVIEVYAKKTSDILAYKEGSGVFATGEENASFLLPNIVTSGEGISGGLEFLLKKTSGKLNGWISSTLSRTVNKFDQINNGKPFFPIQDRRIDITLVSSYQLSKKTKISALWFYTSGNVLNAPLGYTKTFGFTQGIVPANIAVYGNRNSFRSEAFHKLDLTISRTKEKKHVKSTWEFGLYNAYFRKNPIYYTLEYNSQKQGTTIGLKKVYLLPVLPSISYSFSI